MDSKHKIKDILWRHGNRNISIEMATSQIQSIFKKQIDQNEKQWVLINAFVFIASGVMGFLIGLLF